MRRMIVLGVLLGCFCGGMVVAQTYEEMVLKSYDFSDEGDLLGAEACLKAAMQLEPTNPLNYTLLTNLGTLQRRQGKFEDALFSYTAALSQSPNNALILKQRAELYTEMGEAQKAISDYTILLAYEPKNENALYSRGLLYIHTGDYLSAQADFELIVDTYSETFLGRLGYAILEKARKNYDESEVIFNYLIDKYPDNLRVLEERAELFFLTGRNYRAMADINRIFRLTPHPSPELYMLRGRVRLAQKEKASAAVDFKKAQELGYDKETIDRLLKEAF